MRMDIPCDFDIRVSQTAGNFLNIYPFVCQQQCMSMPEVVDSDWIKSRFVCKLDILFERLESRRRAKASA